MDNESLLEKILEKYGWEIQCYSPFEIYHSETNSFATNMAAKIVVDDCRKEEENE